MTFGDLRDISRLLPLTLIAWLLPPPLWRKAAIAIRRFRPAADLCLPVYPQVLGHRYSEAELAGISERRLAFLLEMKLQVLGLAGPWRSWRPPIRLNGVAHLQSALERGRGAILWVTETPFHSVIVKMALHLAGYQAYQLSRPTHGFSSSPFGVRYLNPLWTRVEDRFLAERIMILGGSATDAVETLRKRLVANKIAIIAVNPNAHKLVEVPFLNAQIHLPTGPIRLARASGAALLLVFTLAKDNGEFEVTIEQSCLSHGDSIGDEDVAADYARRLGHFVLDHPEQWVGWHRLIDTLRADRCDNPRDL
jgi:lauroyl/myristoyl acyltransferase